MRFLSLLMFFIYSFTFSQSVTSDSYYFSFKQTGIRGGYKLPIIDSKKFASRFGVQSIHQDPSNTRWYLYDDMFGDLKFEGNNMPNSYFFYDNNPFRDNEMYVFIQSSIDELNENDDSLQLSFKKSDLFPLQLKISAFKLSGSSNYQDYALMYNESRMSVKFIFDNDKSTIVLLKGDYFSDYIDFDPNHELIDKLKKYSFVNVLIEYEEDGQIIQNFYKTSLKGSTRALNRILGVVEISEKNKSRYIYNMGLANMNPFDYEGYILKFLEDAKSNHALNLDYVKDRTILTISKNLEENVIALSLTSDDDQKVIIQIDPYKWKNSSQQKRWYIIYHELGHDILNLEHGQCGPMMNPYAKEDYTWKEFETDKNMMFTEFAKQ